MKLDSLGNDFDELTKHYKEQNSTIHKKDSKIIELNHQIEYLNDIIKANEHLLEQKEAQLLKTAQIVTILLFPQNYLLFYSLRRRSGS